MTFVRHLRDLRRPRHILLVREVAGGRGRELKALDMNDFGGIPWERVLEVAFREGADLAFIWSKAPDLPALAQWMHQGKLFAEHPDAAAIIAKPDAGGGA